MKHEKTTGEKTIKKSQNSHPATRYTKKDFAPLFGCTTYIDRTNGYLIIDSKSHIKDIYNRSDVYAIGMFIGIGKGSKLFVQYGQTVSCYDKKYTRII